LRHDAELWRTLAFRHLIFDEAQALKNPDSQLAKVARSLVAAHPLALTGTPLENNVVELWSLFELLMPGFFGSRRRFRTRWVDPIHKREDAAALARLRRRLRPFLLHRLKREVAAELPPKQTQVLRCRLSKEQRQLYERVRQTYRSTVLGAVDKKGIAGATLHILEALTRLRQACCHPALLPFPEAREVGGRTAKLELLRLLLTQAIADGHRSLVFSQWPSFLDLVAADLREAGVAYLQLDGRTSNRADVLDRWRDPAGPPVFLISTKAGGVGLDLTQADHVFHLDPWWNPAAEDQATDRAHRIGQDRPVMVYKLVAADTVEDKILELQERKRRLFRATVDADRLEVDALSREDLEAVFADPGANAPEEADEDDDFEDEPLKPIAYAEQPRRTAEFVPFTPKPNAATAAAEDAGPGPTTAQILELFPRRK
jgi:SNF2 family DNA or RNA helicase